ncbi:DUF4143 domain-containing protein [Bacteroidales bacterium OttesenSCG-928-B11]|nr:DUF4143 domain-containing protein [Bacteroidales bacterium OttesenSCG-928-E04]MDL2308928.1 DUF4143 domain-containing protein [Bacteroidales bacterium OttesenSCG-928-C03]MDL2312699.1 DUF4143 domain-containing protein [Bacteroidales bacterium OttesenSCG-928-B11]MDL2326259.1 DUF4143 domain-containing protein [Bacteroidales bacterium OttesenSCG-928-A14]
MKRRVIFEELQNRNSTALGRTYEIFPLILPELMTHSFENKISPSFFHDFVKNKIVPEEIMPDFKLDPLYAQKQTAFDFYIQNGGCPAVSDLNLSPEDRTSLLSMYVKTFLERDIRDLASFRDLEPFVRLQRYLANTTGALINYSHIAKDTGVTVPTVQRYVKYMELSYQVVSLPAWFSNPLKRLVKAPKVHFLDNGILKTVLQKNGPPTGNEFESAVIAEIYKQIQTYKLPYSCSHLRTIDGREVDLLLEASDHFIAIEVKSSPHINKTDARHLFNLQEIVNKPLKKSFILSNDTSTHYFGDNIIAMHAAEFLC